MNRRPRACASVGEATGLHSRAPRLVRGSICVAICGFAVACDGRPSNHSAEPRGAIPAPVGTCARPAAVRADTLTVAALDPPCTLRIESLGIELAGDGMDVPAPAPTVVLNSRGQYYTAMSAGGGLGIWSPEGKFICRFGRVGSGPGEFATGWLGLFMDERENLVARDNSSNLLMFDSTLSWKGSRRIPIAAMPFYAHLMEDHRLLVTYPFGSMPTHYFEVIDLSDSAASARRPFGEVRQADVAPRSRVGRASTYIGGGEFWAAPVEGSPSGYQLERWNINGEVTRVLQRVVPWFPRPERLHQSGGSDAQPPPPEVRLIHAFGGGLLLVVIRVNDSRWRPVVDGASRKALEDELYDWRYEVIDADAGAVLASEIADTYRDVPYLMFSGRDSGYLFDDEDRTTPRIRMVRLVLERRP